MSEITNDKEEGKWSTSTEETAVDEVEGAMQRLRINPRKILESLSHLRVDRDRIKPIEGQTPKAGGNADVEAAILASAQSSSSPKPDREEYVAVKKLRFDKDTEGDRALAVIGFVEDVEKGVAWMVFAWQKNGNLREFIRSAKWDLPERLSLVDDVIRGLSYLHERSPPICHGDLKSLNILVNSMNLAVITDFGSARAVDSAVEGALKGVYAAEGTPTPQQIAAGAQDVETLTAEIAPSGEFITMTGPAWTVRWAAPELLGGGLPGLASDIWALGWICWEAVTGNFPFDKETNVVAIVRITKGDLPTVENDAQFNQIKALCTLMKDCWKMNMHERPTVVKCQQAVSWMTQALPLRREWPDASAPRSSGLLFALGRLELNNDKLTEALEYFEQSLKVAQSVGDKGDKAQAFKGIGDTFYQRGEYAEAEKAYIQARDIYSQFGNQHGFAQLVKSLGDVYRIRGNYSKAVESYIQARDIYSHVGSQLGFAQSIASLGHVYRLQSQYSEAADYFIQARDIFSQIGYQAGFAQSLDALGDVYLMRDEYSKAEQSFIQARDIQSRIGNQPGLAQSIKGLGNAYRLMNNYSKAEELYIQARDIYSRIGSQLGFAESLRSLGDVYRLRSEYSKAVDSCIQARDIFSQIENRLGFAQSVSTLGDVYLLQGEYSEAEQSYIQARDIFSEIKNQLDLANSVKSLGDVYGMRSDYSKAIGSYIQARDIYSEIGDQLGLAQSFEGMGLVHAVQKEYALAQECYSEAQQVYRRLGNMRGLANILWHLGWVHSGQAQYRAAERLIVEASTIYGELGLEKDVEQCDGFLQKLRRKLMQ
ncbi:hypothetical protein FS837_012038 [Tulasnella sp. UAMH 9824]|nr:hypothetical protein FS837_012038 [Tulasnella sp. UAMH 9824]